MAPITEETKNNIQEKQNEKPKIPIVSTDKLICDINDKQILTEPEKNKIKEKDNLDEDDDIPSDQKWGCYSFTPHKKGTTLYAFKFRGAYATHEEAQTRAKELQEKDRYFSVFIGPSGKWSPFDDNPDNAKECFYSNIKEDALIKEHETDQVDAKSWIRQKEAQEKQSKSIKELNDLVGEHKALIDKEAAKFEERKGKLIDDAINENKTKEITNANVKTIKSKKENKSENKKIEEMKSVIEKNKNYIKDDEKQRKKMFEEFNELQAELIKKKKQLEEIENKK